METFLLLFQSLKGSIWFQHDHMERFMTKSMIVCVIWSFAGDGKLKSRQDLGDFIRSIATVNFPPQENVPIIDFEVCLSSLPA